MKSSLLLSMLLFMPMAALAEEPQPTGPREFTFRVTGLFSPDRVDDLRALVASLPAGEIKVVSVDYDQATAVFSFDPDELFGKIDPTKIVERFDNLIGNPSRRTFGILPLSAVPAEKLAKIEIPIVGLDCKGCSFAAYDCVYKIEGVERATASFKVGLVTAWIDPEKTNRAALEEMLTKRGIELKQPESAEVK